MTQNTKKINSIMMVFSLVAIVVMPPQIIGGLMGMNVLVPGQGVEDSLWPFYTVIAVMVVSMITILLVFRCKLKDYL